MSELLFAPLVAHPLAQPDQSALARVSMSQQEIAGGCLLHHLAGTVAANLGARDKSALLTQTKLLAGKAYPVSSAGYQNESLSVTAGRDGFGPVAPELLPNPPGGVPAIDPLPMFVPAEKNTPFPRFVVLNMPPGVPCPKLPPLTPGISTFLYVSLKVLTEEANGTSIFARIIWLKFGKAIGTELSPRKPNLAVIAIPTGVAPPDHVYPPVGRLVPQMPVPVT